MIKKSSDVIFKTGELVFKYVPTIKPGQTPKFAKPWKGPFEITNVRYPLVQLRDSDRNATEWIHVNRLKKVHTETKDKPENKGLTEKLEPTSVGANTHHSHNYNLRQRH